MNIKFPRSTIFTVLMLLLSGVLSSTTKGLKRALGINKALLVFLLFFFAENANAQCSITASRATTGLVCGTAPLSNCGGILYIGDGITPMTLTMTANLDLSCLGAIQLIVRNGATIDFNSGNDNLKLAAGSSIAFEGTGTLVGGNCNASERIYIGNNLVASCNGNAGAESNFENFVLQGGYNSVKVTPESASSCGPGNFSFTATTAPRKNAIFKWYTSASGGGTIATGITSTTDSSKYITPTISTTTTYYVEAIFEGSTTPTARKAVTVTVNTKPTVAVNAAQVITCTNTTAPLNGTGSASGANITYLWSTLDGTFSGATNAITTTAIAAGTYILTVTNTTTGCSDFKTVAVTPNQTKPTVVVNTAEVITCANTTAPLNGTGSATSGVTYAWSTADGTFSSGTNAITATATTAGTYTLTVTKTDTGCFDSKTVIVTKNIPTNTWNGAWSTGSSPTSSQMIEFASNYNSTADLEGCSCQVNGGVNVVFKSVDSKSGHTLKITNQVEVLGTGTLTFENNASLVQVNDNAVNSGTITYKRTTPEILKTDYVYWSTPVADAKLEKIQTGTLYYSFNATVNNWTRAYASTPMETGKGYIVRGAGTWFDTGSVTLTPNFIGVPNNGVKTMGIVGGRSNLIGNPYPSAIDADAFILANINTNALSNSLSGSLYFWTHKSAIKLATEIRPGTAGSGAYAYTSDDYATYNLTGGTAGNKINVGKDTDPANKPSGKIAAGQAFFAAATAAGGIATFNNSMRLDKDKEALDNSQFFKPGSATKSSKSIEKNRVWLNLTNAEGAFKQTLIGYITGATNEYEGAYDGDSFNGNAYIDFYSINKDKNLVVQGRALPFDDNDTVPLGYKTTIVGEFKIAIDEADGFLANKKIILEDKLLDKIQDLSEAAYTFTTEKGTFNDRFVLSYANKTLATEDFEAVENRVMITNKNKEVKISTPENQIEAVFIYDILGRQIYTKTMVDKDELLITTLIARDQVLIVKVVMKDKSIITKKTIY